MCKSYLVGTIFRVYNPLHKRNLWNVPDIQSHIPVQPMPQKQIVLLQSLAAMPNTIRHLLQEREGKQQSRQEASISTVLRDLITYEKKFLPKMKRLIAEETSRLQGRDELDNFAVANRSPGQLLDQFEELRAETLSFLTQRLPQDWDQTGLDPDGEPLTLRQHTIDLTEHDRNTLNQLRIDARKRY